MGSHNHWNDYLITVKLAAFRRHREGGGMICHSHGGGGAMVVLCRPVLKKPMCLSSNTDQLRTQLDQLHSEAESTRAKANSARLRLLRLSEAAEKLKRQAAISVTSGKENDARELLFQKKKVISMKENQLIGNVAFDVEVETEDDSNPVRIVSPKLGVTDFSSDDNLKFSDGQNLQLCAGGETSPPVDEEVGFLGRDICNDYNEESIIRGLKDVSSYEDFLEHLDVQLDKIESELVTILNVSALVLNDNEKPNNFKVQQTIELLESVRAIRKKISGIMQKKV
ncbi:hypothetical protein SADUNF_Sadunf05G0148600 [Salix dunnii]|uniref:Uncharacterized protein n=1 Tax=Salix dunnii TaxID=1413687 RepID=A0A835KBG5_9ROSI|nr:hypothetical protein SADUNF_Sadunf05G0148600 [Salix dunnii]